MFDEGRDDFLPRHRINIARFLSDELPPAPSMQLFSPPPLPCTIRTTFKGTFRKKVDWKIPSRMGPSRTLLNVVAVAVVVVVLVGVVVDDVGVDGVVDVVDDVVVGPSVRNAL